MKKFGINVSPVSGKTYVGRINKDGDIFLEKEEVPDGVALEIAVAILKEHMEEGSDTLVIEA